MNRPPLQQTASERWFDGAWLHLRPIRPEDASGLGALVDSLSPLARRNRFHVAVNRLSGSVLGRMCEVDPAREMVYVVDLEVPGPQQILAELRCAVSTRGEGDCAEFALMVAPAWQRHGLARRGLKVLLDGAARSGLHWMLADVLGGNQAMLGLAAACGFKAYADREEEGLWRLEKRLNGCK